MRRKRNKHKGRRQEGSFSQWPHACANHPNYARLSLPARALLFEFLGQYRGGNNGDLCCSFSVLKKRGWRSRDTIERARAELERVGWIVRTRQGGRNAANLYALTFFDIDECGGKLDVSAKPPPGTWRKNLNDMTGSRSNVVCQMGKPSSTNTQPQQQLARKAG